MIGMRSIPALAVIGVAIVAGPTNVFASEHQNTVRQELLSKCAGITGRIHGICMKSMVQQMQAYDAQATAVYQACLANDQPRSVCGEQEEAFWQSLASTNN